ncbi:hypothetical protein SAMN02983003_0622 [Devosia enhydra]|uniref:Tail tubular protein A n=1 Tax=Devosia enhydra TaxID=665118 RepID=A0A1K2HUD9_9HYPH|nr:hypothetical protein [Devosia enhydra]SFZ81663.1 hypothetical protein SAMN02983003_0622 [Devosia enhydra]
MATYRLDAINRCLDAIGESPVNSHKSGVPDAEDASRVIDRITKEVLEPGWVVNTVVKTLSPDLDGVIKIPPNVIKVDTVGRDKRLAVTVRNDTDGIDKLFAIKDQSFIFTAPVLTEVVYYFDIDGLPFPLQNYIAAKSARVFQESSMGSVALDSFTVRQEKEALAMLQDYEAEQEDSNVLTDSAYMRIVTGRNNPLARM